VTSGGNRSALLRSSRLPSGVTSMQRAGRASMTGRTFQAEPGPMAALLALLAVPVFVVVRAPQAGCQNRRLFRERIPR
jgi:hypothetical protein